jgi:hypothetical protein
MTFEERAEVFTAALDRLCRWERAKGVVEALRPLIERADENMARQYLLRDVFAEAHAELVAIEAEIEAAE